SEPAAGEAGLMAMQDPSQVFNQRGSQQPTADARVDAALSTSQAELSAFGEDLKGTGEEIRGAYRSLLSATQAMPLTARNIARERTAIMADDSKPADHRNRLAAERADDAAALITKFREAADDAVTRIRIGLTDALRPLPNRDVGERQLRRSELSVMLDG